MPPEPFTLAAVVADLTAIGVFPVIALAATIGVASLLYRRFRR